MRKEAPYIRFLRSFSIDPTTKCWVWSGEMATNGYGKIKVFGRYKSAHRFSHELNNGPIEEGMEILHSCDNRKCVNPDHLRQGTHAENMQEAAERGRMRSGKDHPMYGKKNPRPKQANPVRVLGKKYTSQNEAERCLGLSHGTVRYWLQRKPWKAQRLTERN